MVLTLVFIALVCHIYTDNEDHTFWYVKNEIEKEHDSARKILLL